MERPRGPPPLAPKLFTETTIMKPDLYDGAILVSGPGMVIQVHSDLDAAIQTALNYDPSLVTETCVLPVPFPFGRVVHAPTGPIDPDYDDVRVLKVAAAKGVARAVKAGIKRPLLIIEEFPQFVDPEAVIILGVLEALYVPIQHREFAPDKASAMDHIGVLTRSKEVSVKAAITAEILDAGRKVACDIGDADSERMSPPRIAQYIRDKFEGSEIKIEVIKGQQNFLKDYPLFAAVDRAASDVERHQGRIVYLEYTPADASKIKETLYLVGKGVTMDTGGIDVKINGAMIGMSRDKCGAAAVVGFMEVVKMMLPEHLKVVAGLSLVRNSVGPNSYVPDELITARSGARVRVFNTDAEGRMVMADVLCKFKEDAIDAVNPHLFTVATLTGHACLAVGEGYSIVMDNGPAKKEKNAERLQKAGDLIGDVFEISSIRQDDFRQHRGVGIGDDIKQSNSVPSSRTPRGHQGPAAFLILASGLDKHGSGSTKPLKYSHLDIASSAGEYPKPSTGAPVLALAQAYILNHKNVA